MQPASDQETIETLQAEVEVLQYKLHELHATDVNTLRRGYITVAQHVDALKHEATRLEELVNELEPELYPPEFIAEEVGKAAVVSGAVYGIFTLVKIITPLPSKASRWLRNGLAVVTAAVVTWRFARNSIGRFAASLLDHKRRRKDFLKELSELQHRIDMLHALTSTMPGVPQQMRVSSAAAVQPAALHPSTSTAGQSAAEAAGSSPPVGQEHFIVVDLPRVESGGFMLQSPSIQSPTTASPAPDTVVVGHPVPSGALLAGWASGSSSRETAAAAGEGSFTGQQAAVVPGAPAVLQQQLSQTTQRLLQQQPAAPGAAGDQQQQQQQQPPSVPVSAFVVPSSVFGWGSVLSQQQLALHPQQQQQQEQSVSQALTGETATGRSRSPETDEGEWVEQPDAVSCNNNSNNSNNDTGDVGGLSQRVVQQQQQQQQQGIRRGEEQQDISPVSSADEGVLLERE